MYTRREFGKATLAGLTLPMLSTAIDSTVAGVRLGVQTYSFRDLPRSPTGDAVDVVVKAIADCGLGECELWAPHAEPKSDGSRDDLRKWRLAPPLDHFPEIKKKLHAAGGSILPHHNKFS